MLCEPPWLAHPHPLLLLAANLATGYMLVSYYRLNVENRYQSWILFMAFVASVAFAINTGHSALENLLVPVPWGLYFGLAASDMIHASRNIRKCRLQSADDTEKQQLHGRPEELDIDSSRTIFMLPADQFGPVNHIITDCKDLDSDHVDHSVEILKLPADQLGPCLTPSLTSACSQELQGP